MDNNCKKTHNVVTMSSFQPHRDYAALSQVEAYWEALRNGRDMPRRAEIDPRGIETALEFAFILERVAPGVARLRIAGSHLHDIMGMEVRGMPLTSFFNSDARQRVGDLLEEVFQTPAMGEITMQASAEPGLPPIEARMILLPLKSDLGDASRIIGAFVCPENARLAPNAFALSGTSVRRIGEGPITRPAPTPLRAAEKRTAEQATGFTEAAMPFGGRPERGRPPYLRLVKSDSD